MVRRAGSLRTEKDTGAPDGNCPKPPSCNGRSINQMSCKVAGKKETARRVARWKGKDVDGNSGEHIVLQAQATSK